MEIILRDMSEYPQVLRRIFQSGERRSPRGVLTWDLGFTTIILLNPMAGGLPLGIGRNVDPAIGAVEAVQLIAGVGDSDLVLRLAPQMKRYTDPVEHDRTARAFWGAYGDRIKLQAHLALKKITRDRETRQAIVTLWDPWLDNVEDKHDYPCTIALQFHMRDGLLEMNTIMRSNDAWLGLPYDVFQFTQLQASMALSLGTHPGLYRHTVLSLHLYDRDVEVAKSLVSEFSPRRNHELFRDHWQPRGIGHAGQSFTDIMTRAQRLIDNEPLDDETESERWYRDRLHGETNVG